MYVAAPHRVDEAAAFEIAARARLGLLITTGPAGLFASHAPFLVDPVRRTLTAHLARANPHRAADGGGEALVVFTGPDAYVSPGYYPSKAEHGRVAPTWNYEAAQFHGGLEWFDDPAELKGVVRDLTDAHEAERPQPWSIDDAPADYVEGLTRGFVGLRLFISRISGKAKLNQTSSPGDHAGVVAGLSASCDPLDRAVADRMRHRFRKAPE